MRHLKDSIEKAKKRSARRAPDIPMILLGGVAVVFVLLITLSSMALAIANQETVAHGVKVENQAIDGLTRQEAYDKIKSIAAEKISGSIIHLAYNDQKWDIPAEEIGMTINVQAAFDEAYDPGHTGGMVQRLKENLQCMVDGKNITFTVDYGGNLLDQRLQQVAEQIRQKPSSAYCYFGPELSILRSPAVTGLELNIENLTVLLNRKLLDLDLSSEIILEPEVTQPPITDADLANMDTILGKYTTHFADGGNRGENIRIASVALNGAFVKPNTEFSFNDRVGYRTAANGYKSAPVIIAGTVDLDYGGGVCQVSTTLYNAVLLAGLNITERSRHSFPSSYVPLGQDATVADGLIDFKFTNPYPHGVCILTSCYDGNITAYIVGCGADMQGREYKVINDVRRYGAAPIVSVYRTVYQNGDKIATETLHTDYYDSH